MSLYQQSSFGEIRARLARARVDSEGIIHAIPRASMNPEWTATVEQYIAQALCERSDGKISVVDRFGPPEFGTALRPDVRPLTYHGDREVSQNIPQVMIVRHWGRLGVGLKVVDLQSRLVGELEEYIRQRTRNDLELSRAIDTIDHQGLRAMQEQSWDVLRPYEYALESARFEEAEPPEMTNTQRIHHARRAVFHTLAFLLNYRLFNYERRSVCIERKWTPKDDFVTELWERLLIEVLEDESL